MKTAKLNTTFVAIFPDLEMKQFLTVNFICQACKLKLLDMFEILDNIYTNRFLLVAFVK